MSQWRNAPGPLDFGAVLDAGFGTFRRGFWQFALVMALPVIVITVVNFVLLPPPATSVTDPALAFQQMAQQAPFRLFTALLGQFQLGATIAMARQIYAGEPPNLGAAYALTLRRFPTLIVTSILTLLVVGIGLIFLLIPGIFLAVRFSLGPFVVLTEGSNPFRAMGKSYTLVKGYFWRVLGIVVVTFVLLAVLSALLLIPFGGGAAGLAVAMGGVGNVSTLSHLSALVVAAESILLSAFPTAVMFVQYADLRIRKEGLDLSGTPAAL